MEILIPVHICTRMFTKDLFVIEKNRNNLNIGKGLLIVLHKYNRKLVFTKNAVDVYILIRKCF